MAAPHRPPARAHGVRARALDRARRFTEDVLMPREELAERNGGRLPDEDVDRDQARGDDSGLAGGGTRWTTAAG